MSKLLTFVRYSAIAAVLGAATSLPTVMVAEDGKDGKPAAKADEEKDDAESDIYTVPDDASVDDLLLIIKRLREFRPSTRAEYDSHVAKAPAAMKTAAERVLKLEKDPKSDNAKVAKIVLLSVDIQGLREATPEDKAEVFARTKKHVEESEMTGTEFQLALQLGMGLEYGNARDLAGKAYSELGEMLAKSDDKNVAKQAQKLIGAGRRMSLVGRPLELKGETLGGESFDVAKLKGKVVLIDFWATWCGPCLAEYPNILKNYEAYHDKGFEVVGVSLDADRAKLEKYVEDKHVPWTTLHDEKAEGQHPAADYYGIFGIPAVILIDKEGNVVSLNARGEELGKLLEKELGPAPEKDAEKEASK
jgi:thiol-disulfide isomerase/thioredoxin